MRVAIYDILSMAIIPTLSTSILFCNLCYILLYKFHHAECGANRHTDIEHFATLIHTKKINTLCGDFYHTVWQLLPSTRGVQTNLYREIWQTDLSEFHSTVWEKSPKLSTKEI